MKRKTFKILTISLGAFSMLLLILAVIAAVVLKKAGWFTIPGGIIGFSWFLFLAIWLIRKVNTPAEQKGKIDLSDAKKKEIYAMKFDEDNADNFKIENTLLQRRGKGETKTDVVVLEGIGTEKNQRRVSIINLDEKNAVSRLIDPTPEEIAEGIRLIAKEPEDPVIQKKTLESMDRFGMLKREITEPISTPKKDELDKKEGEDRAGL